MWNAWLRKSFDGDDVFAVLPVANDKDVLPSLAHWEKATQN